jgi:hypothetical protein
MPNYDHYEITYRSQWNGSTQTHVNNNSEADARGWASALANSEGCKATAERVSPSGERTHIVSEGHDR